MLATRVNGKYYRNTVFYLGIALLGLECFFILYLYVTPNLTQGHFFYNVKRQIEQWYVASVDDPSQKVALYNSFTRRRLQEVRQLVHDPNRGSPLFLLIGIAPVYSTEESPGNALTQTVELAIESNEAAIDQANTIQEVPVFLDAVETILETTQEGIETMESTAETLGIVDANTMGSVALGIIEFEEAQEELAHVQTEINALLESLPEEKQADLVFEQPDDAQTPVSLDAPTQEETRIEEGILVVDENGDASVSPELRVDVGQPEMEYEALTKTIELVIEAIPEFEEALLEQRVDAQQVELFVDRVEELATETQTYMEIGNVNAAETTVEQTAILMTEAEHFLGVPLDENALPFTSDSILNPVDITNEVRVEIPSREIEDFEGTGFDEIFDGDSWNIVAKNKEGQVVDEVIADGREHRNPDGEEFIVWQTLTDNGWEIMGKPEQDAAFFITQNAYDDTLPKTDGGFVVWQGQKENRWQIFLYTITTATTSIISTDGLTAVEPEIENGIVSWKEWSEETWQTRTYP